MASSGSIRIECSARQPKAMSAPIAAMAAITARTTTVVRRRMNADNRDLELTRPVARSAGSLIAATKALRGDEKSLHAATPVVRLPGAQSSPRGRREKPDIGELSHKARLRGGRKPSLRRLSSTLLRTGHRSEMQLCSDSQGAAEMRLSGAANRPAEVSPDLRATTLGAEPSRSIAAARRMRLQRRFDTSSSRRRRGNVLQRCNDVA